MYDSRSRLQRIPLHESKDESVSLGKVVAVVQARMGSSRLPNKVMAPITGKPMIELPLTRLSLCPSIDEIVVATSEAEENKPLKDHVAKLGYRFTTGSEEDARALCTRCDCL